MPAKRVFCLASIVALSFTVLSAREALAQGRGFGRPQGPLMLAANEAVQKDLGLKPDQADKLKDLAGDVREEMQSELAGAGIDFQGLQDLSREERQKRMAEIQTKMAEVNKKINAKFMPKLNEILDKGQQTRLHEIALQAAGPAALEQADVVKALAITSDQQEKLKKLNTEMGEKRTALFTAGGDREERMAKAAAIAKEHGEKANEILTKDQMAKFEQMKGKPFDVSQLRRRRPQ